VGSALALVGVGCICMTVAALKLHREHDNGAEADWSQWVGAVAVDWRLVLVVWLVVLVGLLVEVLWR
jgi:hypothetical protein